MKIFYGWYIVAALLVMQTFTSGLGFYNHSVLLHFLGERFDLTEISGATSVFFVTGGIAGLFIGNLLERIDVRIIMSVGALLGGIALTWLGFVSTVFEVYAAYILFGIGFSASGLLPATTLIARWFEADRAKALSIASTGLSLGGVIVTPVSAATIQSIGLADAGPLLGLVFFLGVVPLTLLVLRSSPADMSLVPQGSSPEQLLTGMAFRDAVRGSFFWVLSVAYLLTMLAQVGGIAHQYGGIVSKLGTDAAKLGNRDFYQWPSIVGRLTGGFVLHRFNTVRFTQAMMVLQFVSLALFAIADSTYLVAATLVLFGLTVGNLLMLQPLLIAEHFGSVQYGRIYAWSNFITLSGIAGGPALMGFLADTGSFTHAYLGAAAAAFAGFLLFVFAKPPEAQS